MRCSNQWDQSKILIVHHAAFSTLTSRLGAMVHMYIHTAGMILLKWMNTVNNIILDLLNQTTIGDVISTSLNNYFWIKRNVHATQFSENVFTCSARRRDEVHIVVKPVFLIPRITESPISRVLVPILVEGPLLPYYHCSNLFCRYYCCRCCFCCCNGRCCCYRRYFCRRFCCDWCYDCCCCWWWWWRWCCSCDFQSRCVCLWHHVFARKRHQFWHRETVSIWRGPVTFSAKSGERMYWTSWRHRAIEVSSVNWHLLYQVAVCVWCSRHLFELCSIFRLWCLLLKNFAFLNSAVHL